MGWGNARTYGSHDLRLEVSRGRKVLKGSIMFRGRKDFNTSTPKRASSFKSPIDATTQL